MTEQNHADDDAGLIQLRTDLDRLMQSSGPREARDVVASNPRLTGPEVADFLGEAIKRTRQSGQVELAESCEHWLGLLRRFREFGVEAGYLEIVVDALARAHDAQAHRRVLHDHPELRDPATLAYLERRDKESSDIADMGARDKYRFVRSIVEAADIGSHEPGLLDPTEAIGAFVAGFVQEPDLSACRRLLETNPKWLQPPLAVLIGAMFEPFIERARALNALVRLRDLLLRQALFARCQEAGIERAFDELAKGVPWKRLTGTP